MFNFLKAGVEFNELAKTFSTLAVMIEELLMKIANADDKSEFAEEALFISYFAKKGIFERIERFNWPLNKDILMVPIISKSRISITFAMFQTINKIFAIADVLNIANEINEIIAKGSLYYEIEKKLPSNFKI